MDNRTLANGMFSGTSSHIQTLQNQGDFEKGQQVIDSVLTAWQGRSRAAVRTALMRLPGMLELCADSPALLSEHS